MEWNLDFKQLGIACTVDLLWGYLYLVKLFQDGVLCPTPLVLIFLHKGETTLVLSGDIIAEVVPILRGCIDDSSCSSMDTELRGALRVASRLVPARVLLPEGTSREATRILFAYLYAYPGSF
jgi:hypothetical protein